MSARQITNWFALALLGSAWGFTIPLTKLAVSTGHHPIGLIFWQFLFGFGLLGFIVVVRRVPIGLDRRWLGFYLVICLIGTLIPNSFSYLAASQLPGGILGIIIASVPMFALAIGLVIGTERLEGRRLLGVLLGMIAVCIISLPGASLPDSAKAIFVLVALVAPFFYGCESNYLMVCSPKRADPIVTLFMASGMGVVLSGILAWSIGGWVDLGKAWQVPEYALFFSALLHAIAYSGYIWLVARSGAVFAAQISYIVTITAVFFSALILQESYTNAVWLALAIMIGGIALVKPHDPPQLDHQSDPSREQV